MTDQALSGRNASLGVAPVMHRVRGARRPPPRSTILQRLRSGGLRGLVWQVAVLAVVALAATYAFSNLQEAIAARGMSTGFAFLDDRAGFTIGESLIPFSSQSTLGKAFIVGILNSIKVSIGSIVLATLIGVLLGIARVSPNLIVARLSSLYVEAFRNTPQLVQIAFWYTVVTLAPAARNAVQPLPGFFISNRGIQMPWLAGDAGLVIFALLATGLCAALAFYRWRRRPSLGRRMPASATVAISALLVILPPLVGWLLAGMPSTFEMPKLRGFNFVGGLALSAEFVALTLGLSLYIAAFVAEIVRSGIQSIAQGQLEAAQALGLSKRTVYLRIVLPQALRVMVPPLAAQYISLIKNSSLGIAIGYPELFNISNTVTTVTGRAVECTAIMMGCYLLISLVIGLLMNLYNRTVQLRER